MSSLFRPVGRERARVYWVRRGLVLLVVLAVVGVPVWWLWPKSPDGVSAVPPPSDSTPAAQGGDPGASSTPASSGQTSSVPPMPGPQACDPAAVSLSVTGFEQVKVSGEQVFALTVGNSADQACVLTLDADTFSLAITSGSDEIWSTADCADWVPATKVTLESGKVHEFEITWPLQRSKAQCKTAKDKLKAGTYVATAIFGGKVSAGQTIRLVN